MAALFLLPGLASAATVSVSEARSEYVDSSTELGFTGKAEEANHLTVTVASEDADYFHLLLVDSGAPVEVGAGCTGGGATGNEVHCTLHKPRPGIPIYCGKLCVHTVPDSGWLVKMRVSLGNGGSYFNASSLPGAEATAVAMEVTGGSGGDSIATAGGNDQVDPGTGADTVQTGAGGDSVLPGKAPDGPDYYNLGTAGPYHQDEVSYVFRTTPVLYQADLTANDGAPGEADTVVGTTRVFGGGGDDDLAGGPAAEQLFGGAGNDRLAGGGGDDSLSGELGEDVYEGGEGNDLIEDAIGVPVGSPFPAGDSVVDGGPGNDRVFTTGDSDDTVSGGLGDDVIQLRGGDDVAAGGPGADAILGGHGDDRLAGEDGSDRLVGGLGADLLQGGSGDDEILASHESESLNLVAADWPLGGPGSLDGWHDRVGCGAGAGDDASINPWDAVRGCEHKSLIDAVQIFKPKPLRSSGAAELPVAVRDSGELTLSGEGVRKAEYQLSLGNLGAPGRSLPNAGNALALRVRPTGSALRALRSSGHATVVIHLRFHPDRGIARTRTTTLHLLDTRFSPS